MKDLPGNTDVTLSKWDDKFDLIVKWFKDESGKVKLPADLELQVKRWNWIYGVIMSFKYSKDSQLLTAIQKEYPDISDRTARNYLRDTRRLYSVLDEPNLAFERVMLISSMRDTMRRARKKNDLRSLTAAEKNYMLAIGADKPQEQVENKTVINILNFNPVLIGAKEMSMEELNKMVDKIMATDKQKEDHPFDDYSDVSENPA